MTLEWLNKWKLQNCNSLLAKTCTGNHKTNMWYLHQLCNYFSNKLFVKISMFTLNRTILYRSRPRFAFDRCCIVITNSLYHNIFKVAFFYIFFGFIFYVILIAAWNIYTWAALQVFLHKMDSKSYLSKSVKNIKMHKNQEQVQMSKLLFDQNEIINET